MPDPVTAPLHVLVAEDESLAAMALEDFLSRKGYRVTLAQDGQEGLERYSADPADLVITDLRMPRMDGRALIRELRIRAAGLPILVMTGFLSMEAGEDDLTSDRWQPLVVLRKPVSPQVILDTLASLAQAAKLRPA
ncbi:response regulator receiver domain-containing protein [Azospirillum brasilense]|uniref:response regulator n=1 Tax=Azospirillum TaxID=191 RepID=UPI0002EC370B|nr:MULTISPECIES: response regulator [Azospirillum]MBK3798877.1 response regulator [Azospirillum argentinense]NUB07794.1 response regulator [Azospirillum baldaniorum]TWA83809.1 response regulator receiver domain-containing protein [Azospirillum brasilense]